MTSIKHFLKLLRLSHWTKAAFVLLGVFYAGAPSYLPNALLTALAFCLVASAVYIYNDFQDREEDRVHPQKCHRPLVSGQVSLVFALGTLAILLISGMILGWYISSNLAALLGAYLLVNLAYNHLLKNVPILDVLSIASGFFLRVLAGTVGIGLPISWWLAVSATLISLFIALCKRRLEKQMNLRFSTRAVLDKYSSRLLDGLIILTALASFITYFFYTIYARDESFYFLLTLPFAAIGIWRFAWLTTHSAVDDDPVTLFFEDNLSCLNLLCFFILTFIALVK
jgi:4-hydroxybenzoate polyprenyltransferase